jgi:hypothetical protein
MGNTSSTRALGYIQGLLIRLGRANCTNLVKRVGGSHDRFTKLLNTTGIEWGSILIRIMFRIFGSIEGGYLIIDETTIDKSCAKVMDGFYSADKILKLLHEWNWQYSMRVKKNRVLGGQKISTIYHNPYWEQTGTLSCKLYVKIIRHGKRYFVTNDFITEKKQIVDGYGKRWKIEEVFRVLHSELGLDECESRSRSA